MNIRPLASTDLPACAGILRAVYNNELWQCRWTQETAEAYLADHLQHRAFVGYVATEKGDVIGAIFAHEKIWWNNSEVFIEEMFVRPDRQGRGVGSMLMHAAEDYVRQHNLAGITLSTNRFAPAAGFYRRHGFADCEHVLFMAREMN